MGADFRGFDEAEARLAAGPARLRDALYAATKDGTALVATAIRANTPVRSGRLLAGWRTKVEQTGDGAVGTISDRVRYAPFVERGQHPHEPMRAQPMVAKGVAETTEPVRRLYEIKVAEAVRTL